MKLKKVVSLALAGVMAVSMLAGCGTSGKQEPTEDENGAVKAGYSAEFGKIVDLKDMDYVTFQDSTVDQEALKSAVASCTDTQLLAALVGGNGVFDLFTTGVTSGGILSGAMILPSTATLEQSKVAVPCESVFTDKADLELYREAPAYTGTNPDPSGNIPMFDFGTAWKMLDTRKEGVIIAVDGTMDTEAVLNQVNKLVTGLDKLQKNGTNADGVSVNYHYTVSVSIVSRTTTMTNLATADIDFVAVTVTRTGTLANEA